MLRLCPQCYACLKWADKCDGGVLKVVSDCPAYAPVEAPIGVEAETLSLFEEET